MAKGTNNDKATASPLRRQYAKVVVLGSVGIVLALTEFICLPMVIAPRPIAATRVIHGELICPPTQTNSIITAQTPAPQNIPTAWPIMNSGSGPGGSAQAMETVNGYLQVGFDKLASFPIFVNYQITDPVKFTKVAKLSRSVPGFIQSLDNREIALKGFMLPLKFENARVTEFLLMRNRSMCCYGKPLQINELAYVRMKNPGVKSVMDQPLTIYGTLHVGELAHDGGAGSIYRMDGEKMDEPVAVQ